MRVLFAAALAAMLPFAASAASLDAVSLLRQFNLITVGDVAVQSLHVHGRALIGGTVTGNLLEVDHDNIDAIVASDYDELILTNATSASHVRVMNGGTASFNGNGSGIEASKRSDTAVAPDDYVTVLSDFATLLADLPANAVADKATYSNRIIFDTGLVEGIATFSITAADLANRDVAFALNAAQAIVINVTGSGDFNLYSNLLGDKSLSRNIIWNFTGFDNVNLYRSLYGSVLAGDSHVYLGADLEGSLFAGSLTGQAQLHVQPLSFPDLTKRDTAPVLNDPAPVPVPASLPLLAGGLALAAALRRRA